MEQMRFKTSIKCNGCLEKVTLYLNNAKGIEKWKVDLENPEKVLTVKAENASEGNVIKAVEKAVFEIQRV